MSGYPPDWDSRRKEVYRRDNYECQNCGTKGGKNGSAELHAHHIVPISSGGNDVISNLTTLCRTCHGKIHLICRVRGMKRYLVPEGRRHQQICSPPDSSELFRDGELQDHNFAQSSFSEDDVGTSVTECDLTSIDTSNVETMEKMFFRAKSFNQDISGWDTSNVKTMSFMFFDAESFDQDIGNWDTSNVETMENMFFTAYSFNQDISSWCVEQITEKPTNFDKYAGFEGVNAKQPDWGDAY